MLSSKVMRLCFTAIVFASVLLIFFLFWQRYSFDGVSRGEGGDIIAGDDTAGDECNSNADCGVGGCSGQVCGKLGEVEGVITTCEMRPEYDCLQKTSCGCVMGQCKWAENKDYVDCMSKFVD